jgi:hypothetical protein
MTATATTTVKEPTPKQLQTIEDLAAELGLEINPPATFAGASGMVRRLIAAAEEHRAANGTHRPPTAGQRDLLAKLGEERGREYKIPATFKQADARIRQILAAGRTPETQAAA